MYFVISFVLAFFSYLEFYLNKNYLFKIFNLFFVGIIFFILLGFNTYSPDLENYRIHFQDLDEDYIKLTVEPFILFLMETCKNLGLSFEGYQIVFAFLTLSMILLFIFKFSPLPVFVLFNFYFIPFFPNITQIRFFLGFAFFLFSLHFFKKRKWLFYFFLILSFLSHLSLIMMLLFFIFRRYKFFKNQIRCNVIIFFGVGFLLLVPINSIDYILELINPKLLLYTQFEERGSFLGTLVLFVPFFILNNIIIYLLNNKFLVLDIDNNFKYFKNIPLLKDLIQFSNFTILFQYFIRDFSRITQNIHVITIISFSIIVFWALKEEKKNIAKSTVIGVFSANIFIFYTQFLMINNFKYFEIINSSYTSNSIFNFSWF